MSFNCETNMYEGYIYKIYNDINDKIYIGQTASTIKERWHGHCSASINQKYGNNVMYKAMRKYGRDKFHISEIEKIVCSSESELIEQLNIAEIKYIKQYKSLISENGYNFEAGGRTNKKVLGKKVCKYDLDLNLLEIYDSLQEAGRHNNIDGSTIWAVCNHHYYLAGGFVWSYYGENPVKPNYIKRHLAMKRRWANYIRPPKIKKIVPKKVLTFEEKQEKRLIRLLKRFRNEKIYIYNSFGEVVQIYDNCLDAIDNMPILSQELFLNLEGKKLCYKKSVIRYESDSFDKYPRSLFLQPITVYNMQGEFVANFESKGDAEKFLGISSGKLTSALKRGGSCGNHLVAEYGKSLNRKLYRDHFAIEMLDDKFNVIKTFENKMEINKYFNIVDCHHSINNAITKKIKYRGYYWRTKEEFKIA